MTLLKNTDTVNTDMQQTNMQQTDIDVSKALECEKHSDILAITEAVYEVARQQVANGHANTASDFATLNEARKQIVEARNKRKPRRD